MTYGLACAISFMWRSLIRGILTITIVFQRYVLEPLYIYIYIYTYQTYIYICLICVYIYIYRLYTHRHGLNYIILYTHTHTHTHIWIYICTQNLHLCIQINILMIYIKAFFPKGVLWSAEMHTLLDINHTLRCCQTVLKHCPVISCHLSAAEPLSDTQRGISLYNDSHHHYSHHAYGWVFK